MTRITMNLRWAIVLILAATMAQAADPAAEDLTFVYKPIPKAMNGFPLIQQAIKARVKVASKDWDILDRIIDWVQGQRANLSDADRAFAKAHLKKNAKALALFDMALASKRIQCPEIKSFSDLMPYLSHMRSLARLKAIRATFAIEVGLTKKGFDEISAIIDFGGKLKASDSCLITYLVGKAVEDIGIDCWIRLLPPAKLSTKELTRYATRLTPRLDDRAYLVQAIKIEHKMFKHTDSVTLLQFADFDDGRVTNRKLSDFRLLPGFYDAERTTAVAEAFHRNLISQIMHRRERPLKIKRDHPITRLMSFNLSGEKMVDSLAVLNKVGEKSRQIRTRLAVLQLLLCLKAYYQDHGRLPDTLMELVKKKYLASIPDDPYGPGKLKYSKARGVIWTVGLDGEGQGGTPATELARRDPKTPSYKVLRHEKDPTFEIPFGQPKRAADVSDLFEEK